MDWDALATSLTPVYTPRPKNWASAAKLTQAKIDEIRERYAKHDISMRALAKEYGIVVSTVYRIVSYEIWRP